MFLGQYQRSVDSKGRLIIPDEFRKETAESLFLTRGLEQCIFVFNQTEWDRLYQGIAALPLTRKEGRSFARIFLANAASVTLDPQGRVMLPWQLREHAGLDRKAIVVGVGTRIEIWSEENWKRYAEEMEGQFEGITEGMIDTGI